MKTIERFDITHKVGSTVCRKWSRGKVLARIGKYHLVKWYVDNLGGLV